MLRGTRGTPCLGLSRRWIVGRVQPWRLELTLRMDCATRRQWGPASQQTKRLTKETPTDTARKVNSKGTPPCKWESKSAIFIPFNFDNFAKSGSKGRSWPAQKVGRQQFAGKSSEWPCTLPAKQYGWAAAARLQQSKLPTTLQS